MADRCALRSWHSARRSLHWEVSWASGCWVAASPRWRLVIIVTSAPLRDRQSHFQRHAEPSTQRLRSAPSSKPWGGDAVATHAVRGAHSTTQTTCPPTRSSNGTRLPLGGGARCIAPRASRRSQARSASTHSARRARGARRGRCVWTCASCAHTWARCGDTTARECWRRPRQRQLRRRGRAHGMTHDSWGVLLAAEALACNRSCRALSAPTLCKMRGEWVERASLIAFIFHLWF